MAVVILAALLLRGPQAPPAAPGARLFAETCAACHGADAKGDNGPNLTTLWASGATDDRVAETIRRGVPGSVMPPSHASDAEIRAIVVTSRVSRRRRPPTQRAHRPSGRSV
jgi:mono/diheme cytochrome c family protein